MGLLSRVEHEAKAIYQELKGLPFSAYGGNSRGGYGMSGYGNLLGGNYFGNLPGTKYDYNEAAGVLWENPSAAACFVALTKAFAQARPILEKRTGKDWKQVDDHPLVEILNTPNQFYSGEKMFGVTLISTMSNGAAFWRLERNGANLPGEIWFEPPYGAGLGAGATGMAPNWDATDFIKNYTYFVDGKPYEINREDVVFFRHGLHPANPRLPWSPLRLAAREIATLNGASTYTGAILRNSAVPSGMLSMEGGGDITAVRPTADQAAEIKQQVKAGFRGDNVGEPFVSNAPWKWTPFNWSPAELAIDKIQQWPQGIVCALLATPEIVALLPTPEPPTYANLDASMRWWWDNTIIPLEDSFADDIETQLFPSFGLDSNDYRLTWDRSKVPALQEDENAKWTMITNAYKLGVIDRDEARVKIGYDSKPEYQGQFAAPAKDPTQPDDPVDPNAVPVAAKSYDASESRDDTGKWTAGGGASKKTRMKGPDLSEKSQRAKDAHVMVDKEIQQYAEEHNEPKFAKAMGGVSFPDSEPIDVAVPNSKGIVTHGIELKTMVKNSNAKITMKKSAQERKADWAQRNKATVHTVVFDDSKVFNANGPGKHDESKRVIYYRRGTGSFRVNGMHPVKDLAELKQLLDTPNDKLPKAAQSTSKA